MKWNFFSPCTLLTSDFLASFPKLSDSLSSFPTPWLHFRLPGFISDSLASCSDFLASLSDFLASFPTPWLHFRLPGFMFRLSGFIVRLPGFISDSLASLSDSLALFFRLKCRCAEGGLHCPTPWLAPPLWKCPRRLLLPLFCLLFLRFSKGLAVPQPPPPRADPPPLDDQQICLACVM